MTTISNWCQLVNEAKISDTNGAHKWICRTGKDQKFQALSDKEITDSQEKVSKLSLFEITNISNRFVDNLSSPIQSLKKNYQLSLIKKIHDITVSKATDLRIPSKNVPQIILESLRPLEQEGLQLQQIFHNILEMAKRGESNRQKIESFWKRTFTYFISMFYAPSIPQIQCRLNNELQGANVVRDMAIIDVQTQAFAVIQKGEGEEKLTLKKFMSEYANRDIDSGKLLAYCVNTKQPESILTILTYQKIWKHLEAAPRLS